MSAAGFRIRLELEPLDEAVEDAVRRQVGKSLAEVVSELGLPKASWLQEVDYRLVGNTAALLLGAPIVVEAAEVSVADTEETMHVLSRCMREWRFWVFNPITGTRAGLPEEPERLRDHLELFSQDGWLLVSAGFCTARLRLAPPDEVARRVKVTVDGHQFWVAPVHELATLSDPLAKRYLQRLSSGVAEA